MKKITPRLALVAAGLLAGLVGFSGCGDDGNNLSGSTGRVQVALTDQAGDYTAVVLSIRQVLVAPAGREDSNSNASFHAIATFSPSRVVDVTQLRYQQQLLGEAALPVGTYRQVRLVLDTNPASGPPVNYLKLPGDATHYALRTPSAHSSGLKVTGAFNVTAGALVALVLDFDPDKAVVAAGGSGNYNLKPTGIRLCEQAGLLSDYGSLSGAVLPSSTWASAVVRVVPIGSSQAIVTGTLNPDDGSFRAQVPAGTYYIRVDADGFDPFDSRNLTPTGVYPVALHTNWAMPAYTLTP